VSPNLELLNNNNNQIHIDYEKPENTNYNKELKDKEMNIRY